MTIPLERSISRAILKRLNGIDGCRAIKLTPGIIGTPDILAVYDGKAIFLEVKRPVMGRLTLRQHVEHERWHRAGALVAVVHSADAAEMAVLGNRRLTSAEPEEKIAE